MKKKLYDVLIERKQKGLKSFAVLIDPDKIKDWTACAKLINMSVENKVDFFFVGGSLLTNLHLNKVVTLIKSNSHIPVVLFPGSNMHINTAADAILFLSLLSGRNADLLIGQHVVAAIYMDAGSGAANPISPKMIASVRKAVDTPLIIGGGINTIEKAMSAIGAGADLIVVGNAIEKNPSLLIDISAKIGELNGQLLKNSIY